MNIGEKPDLLIYHGPSCLDGWGCVWAIHQKWPGVPVHAGVYGQSPPDVTGLRVLIADFSYPEDVMRELCASALSVTMLDHHRSSLATFNALYEEGLLRGEHDETRSGAMMTWQYAWGSRAPRLIEHIQDRDLWKFEVDGTREVTAVLASLGLDEPAWTVLAKRLEGGERGSVMAEGAAILRQHDRDVEAIIRAGARTMIIGDHRVPVCNAPFYMASDVAGKMAEGQPFAATYMDLADGTRQFSLRSQPGGVEVHTIAESYGGSGHPAAAGFTADASWQGDIDQGKDLEVIVLNAKGKVEVQGD